VTVSALPAQEMTKPGPKQEKFNKLFTEWKSLLGELRTLKTEYPDAAPDRRKQIESQYGELVKKGSAMQDRLLAAGVDAFKEAPNADKQLSQFLVEVLQWDVQTDNYERAFELGRALLDSKIEAPNVAELTGVAAFNVMELGLAEKYLQAAKERGTLSELAQQCLDNLAYYREVWPKEKATREAEARADDLPRVLLETNKGDIEVELFENEAPNTVANFISLVEKGFYDGLTFHRVLPGFMAQGGDPQGTGGGGPGYSIRDEVDIPNHRLHFRGSLSMAKTAMPHTGGSQFFLTFVPTRHLDGIHTVFGRVVKGMEVLAKLQRRDPDQPELPAADTIVKARVLRKRNHEYTPQVTAEK
jgi:cyclophilin family peptidyl-prolyl cis-trans isomerase